MCNVKNWKVYSKVNFKVAYNAFKNQKILTDEITQPECIAIRNQKSKHEMLTPGVNIDKQLFTSDDFFSDEWEILVPDNERESVLENLRTVVKENNFTHMKFKVLERMNIDEIFEHIVKYISSNYDAKVKYRIIKAITEQKLYKS